VEAPICATQRAEPLKCFGSQPQGNLTCGKVSTERRSLSGIKPTEVGRTLRLCLHAQWLKRNPAQRERRNAGCEWSYLKDDAIDENTNAQPLWSKVF